MKRVKPIGLTLAQARWSWVGTGANSTSLAAGIRGAFVAILFRPNMRQCELK